MTGMLKFWRLKWKNRNFKGILEDKVVEETMLPLHINEDETRQVISNMLDGEEVYGESNIAIMKVTLMVEYDGHQIFKAILVSQLNANPFLFKDMLTWVKNAIYFKNNDDYIYTSSSPTFVLVGLAFNAGVLVCLQIQLEFLQQFKLPRNIAKGYLPRTTQNFSFPRNWQWYMVDWACCTKWELCMQPVNLPKRHEVAFKKGVAMPTFYSWCIIFPRSKTSQIPLWLNKL